MSAFMVAVGISRGRVMRTVQESRTGRASGLVTDDMFRIDVS